MCVKKLIERSRRCSRVLDLNYSPYQEFLWQDSIIIKYAVSEKWPSKVTQHSIQETNTMYYKIQHAYGIGCPVPNSTYHLLKNLATYQIQAGNIQRKKIKQCSDKTSWQTDALHNALGFAKDFWSNQPGEIHTWVETTMLIKGTELNCSI